MAGPLNSTKNARASLSTESSPMKDETTLTISPKAIGIRMFKNATTRAL